MQDRLQLCGRHLETVHLDHLLRAIGQVDPPFGFEPSDVTRPIPAPRERIGRGLLGKVADHDGRATHLNFPDLTVREDLTGFEVSDTQ